MISLQETVKHLSRREGTGQEEEVVQVQGEIESGISHFATDTRVFIIHLMCLIAMYELLGLR